MTRCTLRNAVCTPLKCTFTVSLKRYLSFPSFFLSSTSPCSCFVNCFYLCFRESPLMSSDPSSSFSTTLKTLPLPCRCITLLHAPLDKVLKLYWAWNAGTEGLCLHSLMLCFLLQVFHSAALRQMIKVIFTFSPDRWVCQSGVCGHRAQADTSPCKHHLQDLRCRSRWPAVLQRVHWYHEGPAAQGSQGKELPSFWEKVHSAPTEKSLFRKSLKHSQSPGHEKGTTFEKYTSLRRKVWGQVGSRALTKRQVSH